MNKKLIKNNLILLSALILIMISPLSVVSNLSTTGHTSLDIVVDDSFDEEYAKLVPGLGTNVYAEIATIGGHDGSNFPSFTPKTAYLLDNANWWVLSYINAENVDTYLNRNPWNYPEGFSLSINIGQTYTDNVAVSEILVDLEATLFSSGQSADLSSSIVASNSGVDTYVISINSTNGMAVFLAMLQSLNPDGYMTALGDFSSYTTSPVWGGYFGVTSLSSRVAVSSFGWIDTTGIVGGTPATISVNTIIGSLTPAAGSGLSRIDIQFPYPVTVSSISTPTVNPLPHVTGKFQWDQRHPIAAYSQGIKSDYSVGFTVSNSYSFPNIQTKFTVNQTLINENGTLEAVFNLKNTGLNDASNINIELPMGSDFDKIANITDPTAGTLEIDVIKADYYLDPNYSSLFNITVADSSNPSNDFEYLAFNLTGWYLTTAGDLPALWNSVASHNLYDDGIIVVDITATNGFPQSLLDGLDNILLPALAGTSSSNELLLEVKRKLPVVFNATFEDAKSNIYEKKKTFKLLENDFSLVSREVPTLTGNETQYFMTTSIASLAAGANMNISFSITDIPNKNDYFASFSFDIGKENVYGYPTANLFSQEESFVELMKYTFARQSFYGMPFFEYDPIADVVFATGLPFTYENAEGFTFFGQSNGLNIQIADDQAVLLVEVSTDKQVYNVGDEQIITVKVLNIGDTAATNVVIDLKNGILGRNFIIDRTEVIASTEFSTIAAGTSEVYNVTAIADSFLGYHPVYASVYYTSEADELSNPETPLKDYYNLGITSMPFGSAQRYETTSNLAGSLLVPETAVSAPAIPEAAFTTEVTYLGMSTVGGVDEIQIKIDVTNIGEAVGNYSLYWNFADWVVDGLTSIDNIDNIYTVSDFLIYDTKGLDAGQTDSSRFTFKLENANYPLSIPVAVVTYINTGESSLGDEIVIGGSSSGSSFGLDAGSEAEAEGRKSGTEDSEQSSYSASSNVGANVNTEGGEQSAVTGANFGFLGFSSIEVLSLVMLPILSYAILKRRK